MEIHRWDSLSIFRSGASNRTMAEGAGADVTTKPRRFKWHLNGQSKKHEDVKEILSPKLLETFSPNTTRSSSCVIFKAEAQW